MQPSIRYRDWDRRFNAERERQRHGGIFRWGERDCCLVAADFVRAITGWDPAETLRGSYHDERGALEIIRRHGGLRELLSDMLGRDPSEDAFCSRGDVALVQPLNLGGAEQVGVCVGDAVMVVAECGILTRPLHRVACYWRIY